MLCQVDTQKNIDFFMFSGIILHIITKTEIIMPRKETGNTMSKLAARALKKPEEITKKQIQKLAGSVLGQDETKGKRKK